MSWFRPLVSGPAESAAYWGNPFEAALQGMTGFLAGQQQAAAARAEAERQAVEDERAARELAIKEADAATRSRAQDTREARLAFDERVHQDQIEGAADDRAGLEAALLQEEEQVRRLLDAARAGNGAALTQLRLEGMGLTELQAAIENPGPATDASVALAVQVRRAAKKDANLTDGDRMHARVVGEAMAEFVRRRQAGEQITLTGPEYLAIREAANARLITADEKARQAARPATGAAADDEPTEAERVAAQIVAIITEDPAAPSGLEQRVSSQIEGMAALGVEAEGLPEGSAAAMYLGGGDRAQLVRADKIERARITFADLSENMQAQVAIMLAASLASDAVSDITTGFPSGGDPLTVLGP